MKEKSNIQSSTLLENGTSRQPQNAGQVINQVQTVNDIVNKAVSQPSAEEQAKAELRQLLSETRIRTDTEVPPADYTLEVDGKGIFARRDIHAIKAKPKAGKTTALKVFMAALLLGVMFRVKSLLEKPRIVYFDTEQNRTDTKRILEDVVQMTGLPPEDIDAQVSLHSLRRVDQEQLLPLLEVVLEEEKPQVVMLDGIVEFVASFNDEVESKQLVKQLLALSDQHNCAIVSVLHTNKADEDHNMRGHLGSMLAQKCATVLECFKERGSSVITVRCSEARHEEMPEWSFTFDAEGHITDADEQRLQLLAKRKAEQQQRRQEALEKEKQERLKKCLGAITDKGGAVSRKQLTEILEKVLDRKRPTVSSYISEWLNDGSLVMVSDMVQVSPDKALPF